MRMANALGWREWRARALLAAIGIVALGASASGAKVSDQAQVLDDFERLGAWKADASDGVKASSRSTAGVHGGALRLDFDFGRSAGYAFVRRELPLDLPENFEISFLLRANALVNNFEVKFSDASGDNVWWFERRDFEFPNEWRRIKIKKRQISFAWGPTEDRTLRRIERLEILVGAGRGGGSGSIEIDDLRFRALPPPPTHFPPLKATATSSLLDAGPQLAVDGDARTGWRTDPKARPAQSLTVDMGMLREFGGLELKWMDGARARRYDVEISSDGVDWEVLRRVTNGDGVKDALLLPDQEARFVRLNLHEGAKDGYALAELDIKDIAFGASPNAFFQALARDAPRGLYPRGFSGEQPYWTLVGVDGGDDSALLSEDGALEIGRGGFSIEPFIVSDGRLVTWSDVTTTQALSEGYLPVPSVTWKHRDWSLRVTAFARGSRDTAELVARYTVSNETDRPQTLQLALAARPFQVNPPTQFLNLAGGVSAIRSLDWDGAKLSVNGQAKVVPLAAPDRFTASAFEAGGYPDKLLAAADSSPSHVADDVGFASGVLVYRMQLAPRASRTIGLVAPLAGEATAPDLGGRSAEDWLEAQQSQLEAEWRAKLNRVEFDVPAGGRHIVDTLRSSLAQILMTRDGPILRPGTRSYGRSWIRDGAMISESLVRLGHANIAADYLRWFAPHQFDNGKVPCCVDARGADPVPEHDSNGQLIFLANEVFRYTGDRALLETTWPHVEAAVRFMDGLRASERTPANLTAQRRMLFGLLPPSISHEGYASKPAYSYWDVLWGLLGYKNAVAIAETLGKGDAAREFAQAQNEFRRDFKASVRTAAEVHGISYVPGAADLGDFDATSTTIALAPAGEEQNVPGDLLRATFERYWRNFLDRRDGKVSWDAYTPYELRVAGSFVRLGWRERAHELLDYFFRDQRPAAWNQWAEVVGREARQPRFIGDMPHAWIASDYIRSVLDMFAYERQSDKALVLAAGIPGDWLAGPGFKVNNLRTPYGSLSMSFKRRGDDIVVHLGGDARPPGGFFLPWPWSPPANARSSDGQPLAWQNGELHIRDLPAEVLIEQGAAAKQDAG
ncbi:MAG: carbohydrate-binding protein [Hyphomicrobium sp.]|nr:MAG: carbohydrate-binding protein [Hyphomicrobium sp.]